MSATKTLLFVYEPEQVEEVTEYVRVHPDTLVVALDFWAEQELKERGVLFESSRKYLPIEEEQDVLFTQAQTIAREWYRIPEMAFFEHKGVRIGEALEANFDNYLQYVLYRVHILEKTFKAHPGLTSVVVPYSLQKGRMSAPMLPFQFNAPVAIATCLSQRYGFKVETLGVPTDKGVAPRPESQPYVHRLILTTVNLLAALQPRRRRKLYASEDWTHIKSFMEKMNDTELVLTDKSELRKMSWRSLIRLRARFLRPSDVAPRGARALAKKKMDSFRKAWKGARNAVEKLPYMQVNGYPLWPIVESAFDFMVQTYPERVIVDIEGIEGILRREHIDTVLLRASVSAQYHFFVTARIAHSLGIPSIEVQHAGAVLDPRSIHSRLETSYLAAFGPLTCKEYAKRYDERRLRPIGAPRFDPYFLIKRPDTAERTQQLQILGLDPLHPVVLVVMPKEGNDLWLAPWHPTSYVVGSLCDAIQKVRTAVPEIQFIFKFRKNGCAEYHRQYLHKLFPTGGFVASDADLLSMILISDCVMSGMSTALYETMIVGKSLVLYPWRPDKYHNPIYERMAPIVWSEAALITQLRKLCLEPEYREARLRNQRHFLSEYYLFDGHASERMAAFLGQPLVTSPEEI